MILNFSESRFLLNRLSQLSSYTIDMTFKVTVFNKFRENVLHKGRNGAGVKAELFFIRFDKMFGKHHVSDTKRGRDRFGKGIQIYDIIVIGESKQRIRGLCGNRKLRFKVMIHRSWVVFSWMFSYTAEENLQTLCWKCNRSKSNKIANLKDY